MITPASRAAKWAPDEPDGCREHVDALTVQTDTFSIKTDTDTAVETERQRSDEPNACGYPADTSNAYTDMHSIESDVRTANKAARQRSDEPNACGNSTDASSVHTDTQDVQTGALTPYARKTATPNPTFQWKWVSLRGIDIYIPLNVPINNSSRTFIFGRVEGGEEQVTVRAVDETAGNDDGDRNGGDRNMNSTTSIGNVDSTQVEAVLLAVLSWPPTNHAEHPYEPARRQHQRGKLKIKCIKVSQARNGKTTHLQHTHAMRPPEIPSQHSNRVIGPICRRRSLKIE